MLSERAVAQMGLGDHAEHPVADLVVHHARPEPVDDAGEVLAEDREPVLHHVL